MITDKNFEQVLIRLYNYKEIPVNIGNQKVKIKMEAGHQFYLTVGPRAISVVGICGLYTCLVGIKAMQSPRLSLESAIAVNKQVKALCI